MSMNRGGYPGARMDELLAAIRENRTPGEGWRFHVTAYAFAGSHEGTRDSFAVTLRESAWMASGAHRARLLELWQQLKAAPTPHAFDQALAAIYELADLDGCWITFIDPPVAIQRTTQIPLTMAVTFDEIWTLQRPDTAALTRSIRRDRVRRPPNNLADGEAVRSWGLRATEALSKWDHTEAERADTRDWREHLETASSNLLWAEYRGA